MINMRTTYKPGDRLPNKIFSNGIVSINMESISLEKYRDLTAHLECAIRNYEMSNNINDRSYALSIISNLICSTSDINCNEASAQDLVALNFAVKKAQSILKQFPTPTLAIHKRTSACH